MSPAAPEAESDMTAARLRYLLQNDPRFRYLSVDGLNWIDPYTGTLVQAPFDWQEGALHWLRENRPWRDNDLRTEDRIKHHRWKVHLRTMVVEDPCFRRFDPEGRWLNPYTGQWVPGIRRQGKAITSGTLSDMAATLVACPEAEKGEALPPAQIQALVEAAKRPTSPKASGPSPVIKVPGTPLYGGGDLRIAKARVGSSDEHVTRRAIRPSDLIAGYRVLGRIGTGGMSAVYRARRDGESGEVALKVLQAHGNRAESFAERFILEAQAARTIDHPNVVPVYDYGRDEGKLYMTMELMPGGDVEHLLKQQKGPLSERRALEIIRDATAGLIALHDAHIIHRDVKPSNLFISESGCAKIGDLGLAKQADNEANITVDGAAVGTPAFMAPEQARGDGMLDHRVDIYGVGATLFMLLSGSPPYLGGNVFTIVRRVLSEPLPDIRQRNRAVGPSHQLIATATAKDPEDRYPNAVALLAAIDAALAECEDRPPRLVDHSAQTATIRQRLSDHVSTEQFAAAEAQGKSITPSHEHVALERRVDPAQRLAELGLQLGLFEARADNADHLALRMLGDRPLLLLVHTAGVDPDLRSEVIQGLDAIIDDLVAAAPDSTGELFARFHRHLRKAGLPELSAIAVMCSGEGEACISIAGTQPPCRFGDPTRTLDLQQVGYRDGPLGAHERSSRESWIDLPVGGGLAIFSPGTMEASDGEGTAFDLPHLASSLVLNADLSAQDMADAVGEDVDHHAEGQLERDATIVVLKRAPR